MKKIFLLFILLSSLLINAQNVGVGQWEDLLSYKSGVRVAEGGGKVYCATKSGIFSLNKSDNTIERLSKINGLADVEATMLGYNYYSNKLIIAYKNSNIDIIDNGAITNLSDIKRKSILGNKSINNVYFINQYAYLGCGFGIVVIDMDKLEISDTYYIGPNGGALNVRDVTSDDNYFYAATDVGIYRALKNANLADYSSWSLMNGLPTGIYNTITELGGKIYTNFSKILTSNLGYQDTSYVYDNGSWNYFIPPTGYTIWSIKKCVGNNGNALIVSLFDAVQTYDSNAVGNGYIANYFGTPSKPQYAIEDKSGNVWIADDGYGLVGYRPSMGGLFSYFPDGPSSSNVIALDVKGNNLAVAPGGGGSGYFTDGLYNYNGTSWKNIKGNYPSIINLDTVNNIGNVLVDPNDTKRIYATSGLCGLLEFYDGAPVKLYTDANSSLQRISPTGYNPIWTSGMTFDNVSNLWVGNSGVPSSISIKKNDGTWQALNFSPIIGNAPDIGQILVDRSNQKWIVLARGGGMMVYNGTGETPNASNTKKLTAATGNGLLPSTNVFCMAEDQDGEIWVGTDKGIAVFYTPENVFTGDNFDAQQILIEQDGHVQILLETELIQAIAVDGANRKWIATLNSGVFLMSADGITQIHHFDITNSPLFSNDVKSVSINQQTGEVYFGTSKGIIAYRGTATAGSEFYSDVYSFPNPVKHTYDGPIAIKGLVANSIVKITDISGSLVYETQSDGGQAIWNGKNFSGERVSTGVYMVFCANQDGTQKMVTKILFIN
jgi:hypothetical protein